MMPWPHFTHGNDHWAVILGGVIVIILAIVFKVHSSNPAESDGFFLRVIKIHSTTSEGK
jgi:uncharacterized integral membrane protein